MIRKSLVLSALSAVILFSTALIARAADEKKEAPQLPPKQGQREKVELFNGKDLKGWKGHEKYWSVKDGVIIGKNTEPVPVSTYLLTERSFSDFRLVFDFKLAEAEMHSGIAMWGRIAPDKGDPLTYAGHLVMFPSNYGFYDLYGRASIHQNAAVAKPVGKQHDWNHIEILAQGNRIRVVLNGVQISDWRESEPDRIKEAPIGLQLHSNKVPQEVQFKNLAMETFPEDKLITLAEASSQAAPKADVDSSGGKLRMYVGTYTGPKSKGIYRLEMNLTTGELGTPSVAAELANPSFLAIHPGKKLLYAVNELGSWEGQKNVGGVSALAIQASGDLKLLNQQSSGGGGPCHLTVDKTGKAVLVANYGGGSVGSLPIEDGGNLGPMKSFFQHEGMGGDPPKKLPVHGHSINVDAGNKFAIAADLGLDQLLVYKLDAATAAMTPNSPPFTQLATGNGPRHFAFHPNGRYGYVINESAMSVTALAYDAQAGTLKELQTISTIPGEKQKGYSTAEVVVHPSGKFVYGSNRGHNSIAIFKCDETTGKLTAAGNQSSGIKTPRNFAIDPTGQYLIVANQDGHSLIVFRIDQKTGDLSPTGHTAEIGSPVCVRMIAM